MNPHIPAGLVPMMVPQQIGGQQYMMAVRLPSGGMPAPGQPYVPAGFQGVQGLQSLQGFPGAPGQPQVYPGLHAASASPHTAALAHVQSPTPISSVATVTTPSSMASTLMSVAATLPTAPQIPAGAGIPASMFAQYGLSGVPGLPGMSIPGSAVPGMVSAASPITAGHMAMAGAQYPGLAEWPHSAAGAQVATVGGAHTAQLATGIAPSAYSQQVANLASAQLAGLQAQQVAAAGIPAAHMAQYGSQLQAAGLAGLQMAVPQALPAQSTPPPQALTPDSKKKLQQELAVQGLQGLQIPGHAAFAVEQDTSGEDSVVMLDDYNSDLSLVIDENGYDAQPLVNPPGFCFCWAGVRCTHGVARGKAYYECKLTEALSVDFGEDHQETDPHIVRVGWSMDTTSFQLGEEANSFGYGGTGKFATNNKFVNYGEKFAIGDVIGCLLDLDSHPPNMSYAKNGRWLGVAHPLRNFQVGKKENALFPHILTKNIRFEVNFGQQAPWFPPAPGFLYIMQYPQHERVRGLKPPSSKSSCEMIMIIGLPGSGKTTWGINKAKSNPEMRYNIIGTDTLIDKMKVMGLPRKNNYHGRWDVLIDKASKCLNKLFEIASKKKRNFILDQTNVYPSARRRKMRNFKGFIRRAAIIVPDDGELMRRSDKRTYEDGKYVPEEAVLDMKANFKLPPENDENFDYIEFIELPREKATPLVEQYNMEGQSKRPQAVKGNFRGAQNDNRFKPPSDMKQPPMPPAGALQGSQGSHNSSQRAPPPPPPPDQFGAHRDRSGEPLEKRGRYDQAGGSALDFIKQEYSSGEIEAQEQERKAEPIFHAAGFAAEQFAGLPGQATSSQLQEQFAGRGLIAVGGQHFLGAHLQPGQGILGEYGSQQSEQLAAIAYGAQTPFIGGFNPPIAIPKQEPVQQSQAAQAWLGQPRAAVQVQTVFDPNKRDGTPDNRAQQQNRPRPSFGQDQNRNSGQGSRPNSGFGAPRNATPPISRPNQNQSPFQQRNTSPGAAGNRNPNFGGHQNHNKFGGGSSNFNPDDQQSNYDQDLDGSESQDDKQTKRERRRPSKWDNPDDKEGDETVPENGHADFQNALSNLRSKIANQEAANAGKAEKPSHPESGNSGMGHQEGGGGHGGFNPGGQPPKGGPGMMGPGGPGPGGPGPRGPGPMGPRGMNPRGPPPGNFNGPPPFGQPGPPRGPRGPGGPGMDGPIPPFGARGRGGFQERGPPPPGNRGPPPPGNRGPPPRPFGPRGDGDGPRGPPGGPGPGWNPRPGGPPCPPGGPPRGFNPRMGGPPGGPRGPFPGGPPGRFNRPPPPMGQRWQRPPQH